MRSGPARRRLRGPRQGYNLVILMVLVTVMNVLIAIAMPTWSKVMKREREKELIFRGLQYAEAIRVFQVRNGRYPVRLRELLESEPRTIRQLWTDPFRDDGKWGLVTAATQGQEVGGASLRRPAAGRSDEGDGVGVGDDEEIEPQVLIEDVGRERDFGAPEGVQAAGPVVGVHSLTDEDSTITFLGSNSIKDWEFTADLIPILPQGASLESVPRLTSRYIGRSFPEGLEPQGGNLPGTAGDAGDERRRRPQSGGGDDE